MVAIPEGRRESVFRLLQESRLRPVRLSDHTVALIVQMRVLAAGGYSKRYAEHSLRAGFVTAATQAGSDV